MSGISIKLPINLDGHSGNYSLELINVSTFGVVANGTVTNGQVHADFDPNNGEICNLYEACSKSGNNVKFR